MENKDKKKDIVIIILIIIIFILIGLLYIKVFTKKGNNLEIPEIQTPISPTQPAVEEEKELTDVNIKNDISKKASIMLTMGYTDIVDNINTFSISNDLKLLNLTDKEKLGIILNINRDKFQKLNASDVERLIPTIFNNYKKTSPKETPESFANDGALVPQVINAEIINKNYSEMFNSTPLKYNGSIGDGCPTFQYDEKTNYYMSSSGCGGTGYPLYQFNKYKYSIKGNNIFVYVSTSVTLPGMKVYKGIVENQANYLYTATSDEQVTNDIKVNPEKYEQYKLTFEKNQNGEYYYKTTEKISA